jgi:hypothetical protein
MLGMMYDGCLDGAHLDKLFLKRIFLNFFLKQGKGMIFRPDLGEKT